MRGIELPVNTLIIIVIAVIVLVAIIALFTGVWTPGAGGVNLEAVKSTACQKLVSMGCAGTNPEDIQINNFDADNDGATGGAGDTLQALCNNFYGCGTAADPTKCCRELCGCP